MFFSAFKACVRFIQRETVFCVAFLCAACSSFFVPPSLAYLSYIDWNTLCILFALMAVIAGLRSCGVFNTLGGLLCRHVQSVRALSAVLVALCFFSSMFITNDVALLTFVPFTLSLLIPVAGGGTVMYVVILQTIAANTGSMLTPLGNPQNLFLFQQTGLSVLPFCKIMLPYTAVSGVLLLLAVLFVPKTPLNASAHVRHIHANTEHAPNALGTTARFTLKMRIGTYSALFVFCLLSVFRVLPKPAAAGAVCLVLLVIDCAVLRRVDYMLLCTFGAFFVFTGNLSSLPAIHSALERAVLGHEFLAAVCSSQIISNVPATLLLYPFTSIERVQNLLIGVNTGGLGTLVASLASLISYKLYASSRTQQENLQHLPTGSRYLALFTLCNVVWLCVLCALKSAH